jgi:hypothetical protein
LMHQRTASAGGTIGGHQNPVLGSAARFSPTSNSLLLPAGTTSGLTSGLGMHVTSTSSSPRASSPGTSGLARGGGGMQNASASRHHGAVTFSGSDLGGANSTTGGDAAGATASVVGAIKASSRHGSPAMSDLSRGGAAASVSQGRAASSGLSTAGAAASAMSTRPKQQHYSQAVAFANPETVGHAHYFVTMATVPTTRTTVGGPVHTTGRAISPREQRQQDEATIHVEDDHVICYYSFRAHDFPSSLLTGGVNNFYGNADGARSTRVDVKSKYNSLLSQVEKQRYVPGLDKAAREAAAEQQLPKRVSKKMRRKLRQMRRALDSGQKESIKMSSDDDDDDGDDSSSDEGDESRLLDGDAKLKAKMAELVVEAATEKSLRAAAASAATRGNASLATAEGFGNSGSLEDLPSGGIDEFAVSGRSARD